MSAAARITAALGGKWYGIYGLARCVAHDDGNPSLTLRDGDNPGVLLVHCYAGCDSRDVLAELRRRGFIDGARSPASREPGAPPRQNHRDRQRMQRREAALEIWRSSNVQICTAGESYWRSRGLTIAVPPSIRWRNSLMHRPSGRTWPAMVAAVQAPDGTIGGIHRTYLAPDGSGKAPVESAKMILGPMSGGAVRLAAAERELAIGEGIETCASFLEVTGIPTWAALSTGGMRSIVLPPLPCAALIYLVVDADAAGEIAARATAERFIAEGREVKMARPVSGKDMNDSLKAGRHAS